MQRQVRHITVDYPAQLVNPPELVQSPLALPARAAIALETLRQYWRVRRMAKTMPLPRVLEQIRGDLDHPARHRVFTTNPYRLSAIVQRVIAVLPTDTRCLMRSLTLLAMLTRRGTDAVLVLGINRSEEFGAHAWLELDGKPLLKPEPSDRVLAEL